MPSCISCSVHVAQHFKHLLVLGTCRETLKNRKLRDEVVAVIKEAGAEGGCEKSRGDLLYEVAVKARTPTAKPLLFSSPLCLYCCCICSPVAQNFAFGYLRSSQWRRCKTARRSCETMSSLQRSR